MPDILKVAETDMARARRKMKKRIAAAIITAMAETDSDYEFIAKRLGQKPAEIEKWIVGLIAGQSKCMDEVSDLMLAMGCELTFSLQRYAEPVRPAVEQPAEAAAA